MQQMLGDNQNCQRRLGEGSPRGVGGTSADCSDADTPRPDWQVMASKVTATGGGVESGRKTSAAAAAPSLFFTSNGSLTGSDCLLQAAPASQLPVSCHMAQYKCLFIYVEMKKELVGNYSFRL